VTRCWFERQSVDHSLQRPLRPTLAAEARTKNREGAVALNTGRRKAYQRIECNSKPKRRVWNSIRKNREGVVALHTYKHKHHMHKRKQVQKRTRTSTHSCIHARTCLPALARCLPCPWHTGSARSASKRRHSG